MGLKMLTLGAAAAAVLISLYLFKKKKYGYAYSIICFVALAAFVGGGIHKSAAFENYAKNMKSNFVTAQKTTQEQISELSLRIEQALSFKREIIQNADIISDLQKDIADIKQAINWQNRTYKTETFAKADLKKRVAVQVDPLNPRDSCVIFFELEAIPETNSVILADNGSTAPRNTYGVTSNIVAVKRGGINAGDILKGDNDKYTVKYIPVTVSNKEKFTIKGLKMKIVDGNKLECSYELLGGKKKNK